MDLREKPLLLSRNPLLLSKKPLLLAENQWIPGQKHWFRRQIRWILPLEGAFPALRYWIGRQERRSYSGDERFLYSQSSRGSSGTLANSRVLWVTSVAP